MPNILGVNHLVRILVSPTVMRIVLLPTCSSRLMSRLWIHHLVRSSPQSGLTCTTRLWVSSCCRDTFSTKTLPNCRLLTKSMRNTPLGANLTSLRIKRSTRQAPLQLGYLCAHSERHLACARLGGLSHAFSKYFPPQRMPMVERKTTC